MDFNTNVASGMLADIVAQDARPLRAQLRLRGVCKLWRENLPAHVSVRRGILSLPDDDVYATGPYRARMCMWSPNLDDLIVNSDMRKASSWDIRYAFDVPVHSLSRTGRLALAGNQVVSTLDNTVVSRLDFASLVNPPNVLDPPRCLSNAVSFSCDERFVAVGKYVFSVQDGGACKGQLRPNHHADWSKPVAVVWSPTSPTRALIAPSGTCLYSHDGEGSHVIVVDLEHPYGLDSHVQGVVVNPDGASNYVHGARATPEHDQPHMFWMPTGVEYIVATSNGGINFIDTRSYARKVDNRHIGVTGAGRVVWDVSKDGTMLVRGQPDGRVRIFDMRKSFSTLCDVALNGVENAITCVSMSPDAKYVAVKRRGECVVADVDVLLRDYARLTKGQFV